MEERWTIEERCGSKRRMAVVRMERVRGARVQISIKADDDARAERCGRRLAEEEVGTKGSTRQLDVDRCRRPGHGIRRGRDRTMTRWTGRNTTKSAVCLSMVRCVCDAGAQRFAYRANAVLAAFPGDGEECQEERGRGRRGRKGEATTGRLTLNRQDERGCWAAPKAN